MTGVNIEEKKPTLQQLPKKSSTNLLPDVKTKKRMAGTENNFYKKKKDNAAVQAIAERYFPEEKQKSAFKTKAKSTKTIKKLGSSTQPNFYRNQPPVRNEEEFEDFEEKVENTQLRNREKMHYKMKALERQKHIDSEVSLKEAQLAAIRQEHDELLHTLEGNKRKLEDLKVQKRRQELNSEPTGITDVFSRVSQVMKMIQEEYDVHNFEKAQLKHMFDTYKADILVLQNRIQKIRQEIRTDKMEKEKLNSELTILKREALKLSNKMVDYE